MRSLSVRFDQLRHLSRIREAVDVVLREDGSTVEIDVEDALGARLEFGVDAECILELSRQTGGSGEVVSLRAVGDADVHGFPPDRVSERPP